MKQSADFQNTEIYVIDILGDETTILKLRGIKAIVSPQNQVSERIEPLSMADQDPAFYSAFPHTESQTRREQDARSEANLWLGRLTTGSDRFPHDTYGDVARAL